MFSKVSIELLEWRQETRDTLPPSLPPSPSPRRAAPTPPCSLLFLLLLLIFLKQAVDLQQTHVTCRVRNHAMHNIHIL